MWNCLIFDVIHVGSRSKSSHETLAKAIEQYFHECGTVYYAVQGGSNFLVCG